MAGLGAGDAALEALVRQVHGEGLREQAAAVLVFARGAEAAGRRVRLSYAL